MKGSAAKIQMTSLDDLFGGSATQVPTDQIQEISLTELHPFKDHPFHVVDDEKMQEMAESVAQYGVLVPGIVRHRSEGGYEIVAGHQRKRASELAGKVIMPDQGQRFDSTCALVGHKYTGKKSRDVLADNSPDSKSQIQRFIRLTELVPRLLTLVDKDKLPLRPAVEVSYLPLDEQELLYDVIEDKGFAPPSMEQAKKLREYCEHTELTTSLIIDILSDEKRSPVKITLKKKCLSQYFPKDYTQEQMEEVIFSLLETWKSQQKGAVQNDSDG